MHTTIASERQFIAARRNSGTSFDLFVPHRILQYVTDLLAIDIERRQGTVFPLPIAFYFDFHPLTHHMCYHLRPIRATITVHCTYTHAITLIGYQWGYDVLP